MLSRDQKIIYRVSLVVFLFALTLFLTRGGWALLILMGCTAYLFYKVDMEMYKHEERNIQAFFKNIEKQFKRKKQ